MSHIATRLVTESRAADRLPDESTGTSLKCDTVSDDSDAVMAAPRHALTVGPVGSSSVTVTGDAARGQSVNAQRSASSHYPKTDEQCTH